MFTEFKIICFGVLILWSFFATKTCSYHSDEVKQLQAANQLAAVEHKAEIQKFTAEAKAKEAQWAKAESKANEEFAIKIKDLNAMHAVRISELSRVQHSAQTVIKYLPNATPSACTDYATAATDTLVRGAALLGRVEHTARLYDAEIERVIAACPGPIPAIDPHKRE